MSSQSIGYIRVSTRDQSTGRQSDGMESLKLDKVFTEKVSGKSKDRPELLNCINYAREGDTLYIYSIDRLARSLSDLQYIIDELVSKGVTVKFIKESQTYSTNDSNPFNKVLLQVLGAFAEFERNIMLERQAEGIAHAKLHGTKTGKPFGTQPLDMARRSEAIELSKQGNNISQIARVMKLSRGSIYKLLS
jgi:DNA invertase Pin-like site-specific DNA recombinase